MPLINRFRRSISFGEGRVLPLLTEMVHDHLMQFEKSKRQLWPLEPLNITFAPYKARVRIAKRFIFQPYSKTWVSTNTLFSGLSLLESVQLNKKYVFLHVVHRIRAHFWKSHVCNFNQQLSFNSSTTTKTNGSDVYRSTVRSTRRLTVQTSLSHPPERLWSYLSRINNCGCPLQIRRRHICVNDTTQDRGINGFTTSFERFLKQNEYL